MDRSDLLRRAIDAVMPAIGAGLAFLTALFLWASPAWPASPDAQVHLRLVDRLDRPEDGYCIDIPGTPGNMRVDAPLFAHNCKQSLTADSAVVFTSEGYIQFPAVELCVTVAGVNSEALPGAATLLRRCNQSTAFFQTMRLQRFTHRDDGRLVLGDSNLCLTVGPQSAATYSPFDRWRALFVEDCASANPARSRWEFVVPHP